jgi:hypothetical protein
VKSHLGIWQSVEEGRLDPHKAIALLDKMPGGGRDTQTFRRVTRFIKTKQKATDGNNDPSGK